MSNAVTDNPARSRFELALEGGATAFIHYRHVGNVFDLKHTEVPEEFEGKGVGSKLVKGTLEFIRAANAKFVPTCPFVHAYIERHPEYNDLLK